MEYSMVNAFRLSRACGIPCTKALRVKLLRRNYSEEVLRLEKEKIIHPYRKIHPWKSLDEFSDDIFKNVIYNKDGLVAINKPYGISAKPQRINENNLRRALNHKIPNAVDYTLIESLPRIAEQLNYENLSLLTAPERYMSGVTLLAANENVETAVKQSMEHAVKHNVLFRTYWIVTTMISKQLKGKKHLAMKLQENQFYKDKKPIFLTSWSNNGLKKGEIKIVNVEFQVLSNSTQNLSSLIELKISTRKWHAIRLFASTVLFSPVLGDNYHGSRIQDVMGAWLNVDPFLPVTNTLPKLDKKLLNLLNLTPAKQEMIPVHVHLRSIYLPMLFGRQTENLTIEAPLLQPFKWTTEQLMFKYSTNTTKDTKEDCLDNVTEETKVSSTV